MRLSTRLAALEMKHELTPGELLVAQAWRKSDSLNEDLSEFTSTQVVVVGMKGIPTAFLAPFLQLKDYGCFLLPDPADLAISSRTVICAEFIAKTMAGLIKKVLGDKTGRLRGVLSVAVGISANGSLTPGPHFWKLAEIPTWKSHISFLVVNTSVAYVDIHTGVSQVGWYSLSQDYGMTLTLSEIMEIEDDVFKDEEYLKSYTVNVLGTVRGLSPIMTNIVDKSGVADFSEIPFELIEASNRSSVASLGIQSSTASTSLSSF